MSFFETVKGTVTTAVDAISTVTQDIVEKNRTNAKLNRLRLIMKSESELMNRAYIALGKECYDKSKKGEEMDAEKKQKLIDVIDSSKAKIAKARDCYRQIVDSHNDAFYGVPEAPAEYKSSEIVDITVACSNESEYSSSPFPKAEPAAEAEPQADVEEAAEEATEETAENTDASDDETGETELF